MRVTGRRAMLSVWRWCCLCSSKRRISAEPKSVVVKEKAPQSGAFSVREKKSLRQDSEILVPLMLEEHAAIAEGRDDEGRGQLHFTNLHGTAATLLGIAAVQ